MAEAKLTKRAGSGFSEFAATDTVPAENMPVVSIVSPSQITADQDDYAPTGWSTADVIRLNLDTGGRAITGFSAWTNTRQKTIINTSANYGYLPCEHPDSTAANRVMGICDHIVGPYGSLIIEYDSTSSRIRVLSNTFNPAAPGIFSKGGFYQVSPGATLGSDWGSIGFGISSGNNGTNTPTATLPGSWLFTTLTSAAGISTIYFAKTITNSFRGSNSHIIASAYIYLDTLSDGTNTYTFTFGIVGTANSTTNPEANEITIKYTNGTNSGKFQGVCRSSSTESTVDLGVTVAANTPYVLTVCASKSGTEARFYIDGVFSGRITSNVTTTTVGVRAFMGKSAGTTARVAYVANMTAFNIL